jgi:aspartyl-tRNA synthetase
MYRTHTCGELRKTNIGETVTLSGWVQGVRDKGSLLWIDLRDRYGITQITIETENAAKEIVKTARELGREYVISVKGSVIERYSKSDKISTGDIEIVPSDIKILNAAIVPPFTIEDDTDGGDEIRMKYRYLDIRREVVRNNLKLRHSLSRETRKYLDAHQFIEIETPVLIKSTPEGARDFVVPSRMNQGQFYALPQSPQTFKQLLMVSGIDRYYQIVKCFRDEDLRADRQPEFTQIDCEMSFVDQDDILIMFEGLVKHLFKEIKGIEIDPLPRMSYDDAMRLYGNDKPDIRFGMQFADLTAITQNKGFNVFDQAEVVLAIVAPGANHFTRKQLDELTDWIKRPQIGAKGMIYCRCNDDGTFKSSADKFFNENELKRWGEITGAKAGDLILVLSGELKNTRKQMSELRIEMGRQLGLRDPKVFAPLWVTDFPLLELDEDTNRWHAMHHPFTSPKPEDIAMMKTNPGAIRANAYDMVINGIEVGGGSIRIHHKNLQQKMFKLLNFTDEEAKAQFGFLMNAFEYGAPPHGGLAFGFDRLCSLFGGSDSIRDFIAFPKNNMGRDVMIDAPSLISLEQKKELGL